MYIYYVPASGLANLYSFLISTLVHIIFIAFATQNGLCRTWRVSPGLYCQHFSEICSCFVLQHSELAIGCGQSHCLELPETRSASSAFRCSLMITKQVIRVTTQFLIDYLLGDFLSLPPLPCAVIFCFSCRASNNVIASGTSDIKGLHDLPQLEGDFSEKGS